MTDAQDTAPIRFATVAVVDTNGLLRGQKISANNLQGAFNGAMGMAPVQLALDPTDEILEMPGVSDDNADFHDTPLKVDQSSLRRIPWEDPRDNALYLAEFTDDAEGFCPRSILRKTLKRASDMGFRLKYGLELEFTLFNETSDTLWDKDFENLNTATRHPSHDLIIYQAAQSDFYGQVADMSEQLGIRLAKMHEEIGGGFMEACIAADEALKPADQLVLLKNFLRVLAGRRDQSITFMPRWSEQADSQSVHIHLSLLSEDGTPVFWDPSKPHNMSDTFRHFVGGLQAHLGKMMLVFAPTVNSYRRFAEGTFAPPAVTWGFENRTTCLRVVGETPGTLRVENRLPGADTNPYLTVAASLAAGLAGIAEKREPTEETKGNGYIPGVGIGEEFPHTMAEAIPALRSSDIAAEYLGERFVETFTAARECQMAAFEGKDLKDEMKRFFELG